MDALSEQLERHLLWARWEVTARDEQFTSWYRDEWVALPEGGAWHLQQLGSDRWLLRSLVEPVGHPVALRVSGGRPPAAGLLLPLTVWIRLGRDFEADWPRLRGALEDLRRHPRRASVGEFTTAGLESGFRMEDLESRVGPCKTSQGYTVERLDGGFERYSDCQYEGDLAVRYREEEDGCWRAIAVRGATLEDAGRQIARAGDGEADLREVLGAPTLICCGVETDPPQWHHLGVHVRWTRARRVRGFRLGWL